MNKLFSNYEAKLSNQMVKSIGKSIIKMYSIGACAALRMSNQDALSEDLEADPFLNSALQRFMCKLYHSFCSFLAPLRVGLIQAGITYLKKCKWMIKMGAKVMTGYLRKVEERSEWPPTPSKYACLGTDIAAELMIGFWFGIGVILVVRVVDSLNYCAGKLTGGTPSSGK